MKNFTICSILLLALALGLPINVSAESKTTITVQGTVVAKEGGKTPVPVPYAVVALPDLGMATTTNSQGEFEFKKLIPDQYQIIISCLGYETLTTTADLRSPSIKPIFTLSLSSFRVNDVVVTAQSNKSGASTASVISKTAMDHMQASSLADIMSLLPGGSAQKPSLNNVALASIRGNSDASSNAFASNSLGTAVIMDGSPLSNNANMSMTSSALGGGNPSSGFVDPGTPALLLPTQGIDLRTITTDNVESIEVIRGVASVEYGDITSGAVIVKSKSGYQPLNVRFNTNPNVYAFSATQGMVLGKDGRGGGFNVGADYTYSANNPIESYEYYQRVTGRLGYTNTLGRWYTNSSLSLIYTRDKREPNPDDDKDFGQMNQRDLGLRFTTNGTLNFNLGWFKNISYNASFGYTNRQGFFSDKLNNASATYSLSQTDGTVLSSIPGKDVYDTDGKLITNTPAGEMGLKGWQLPNSYLMAYNIQGKELNTYAKVVANFAGKIGTTRHRLIFGADFKNDGNLGEGKTFDPATPPRQSGSGFATWRNRRFKDIPFISQIGIFAEENFRWSILKRELNITAGARFDHTANFGGGWSPRINASFELIPNHLRITGAYGITRKAPTMAYLYPDNAYFDLLNFDNSAMSEIPESQILQVVTTRVFDTKNHDLEMAKQYKSEIGLNATIGKMHLSVVAFKDRTPNGYSFANTPNTFQSLNYIQYQGPSKAANYPTDPTQLPQLSVKAENQHLVSYTTPTNNTFYETKGVEFDLNFGRIDAIRTAFIFNGAYYHHKSYKNGYVFWNKVTGNDYSKYPHMGVYNGEDYRTSYSDRFTTNLIVTHNIPKIGFIITLTANVIWKEQDWNVSRNDSIPSKYISRMDGRMYDLQPGDIDKPEFKGLDRRGEVSEADYRKAPSYPPVLCLNINITKQFKDFLEVSFFANNMFRSTPLHAKKLYPGSYYQRNANVYFFGIQLTAKIK